ncbi:prephenate dehydratase [Oleispirillum naphthae]|uniref:prephenate dehydratase n=1 Tax=Oleispirillum naphthae TaxID=2838853 RepID=UPI0030826692
MYEAIAEKYQGGRIAFQGQPGSYSQIACAEVFPGMDTLPCTAFEDAFSAVKDGSAALAMIPIDNSVAGRVADVHHLLPNSGLYIVGEHYEEIHHQLLAAPGATLKTIRRVRSHVHALSQCRKLIRRLKLTPMVTADTAGGAAEVAKLNDPAEAALASSLSAEIHGLTPLMTNVEDAATNTTRFLIMAREPMPVPPNNGMTVTSFVFRVRNVPAALYKALGGFATNGVNITKLESYLVDGSFVAAQFFAEIEGHPDNRLVGLAFDELQFFTEKLRILGTYAAPPYRYDERKRSL